MNILYLYAHPQTASFNALMKACAIKELTRSAKIQIADLYAEHFNPVASFHDFSSANNEKQYFLAQSEAYKKHELAEDINKGIEGINWADHLIFQFPLWWFSMPAILKGWLDRMLIKGFAYDAGKTFENGLLKDKTASLIITTQSPESAYQKDGLHGATIDDFLLPIHHTLHFVGIKTLSPFVTFGAFNLDEEKQKLIIENFQTYLKKSF